MNESNLIEDDLSSIRLQLSTLKALLIIISLSSLMLFTITGNIMVIIAIFSYRPLKNVQNMFLVSLACADIALAICVMPMSIVYMLINEWIFGSYLCKIWLTCDVLCCTASILNLCFIALDRYFAIKDPINYAQQRSINKVLVKIAFVWLLSSIISIPPLIGWNDWPEYYTSTTPCKLSERPGYVIYSSSGSFYIPLIIMSFVYFNIYKATRKRLRDRALKNTQQLGLSEKYIKSFNASTQGKQQHNNNGAKILTTETSIPSNNTTSSTAATVTGTSSDAIIINDDKSSDDDVITRRYINTENSENNNNNNNIIVILEPTTKEDTNNNNNNNNDNCIRKIWEEKQRISLSKERRAARILGVVMGVFTICWLPFFIMYVTTPFCSACKLSEELELFITWLGYANSALNPIIYTIFNLDFRKAFQNQLKCL